MESIDLKTTGMHCGSCAMLIEMDVSELAGVSAVKADPAAGSTHVEFDPSLVTVEEIVAAIKGAGYEAEVAA
jgi:Cu+-exporting ATPase